MAVYNSSFLFLFSQSLLNCLHESVTHLGHTVYVCFYIQQPLAYKMTPLSNQRGLIYSQVILHYRLFVQHGEQVSGKKCSNQIVATGSRIYCKYKQFPINFNLKTCNTLLNIVLPMTTALNKFDKNMNKTNKFESSSPQLQQSQ